MIPVKRLEGKTIVACDLIDVGSTLCVAMSDGSEYQLFATIHHEIMVEESAGPKENDGTTVD